jgi:hypothetical protein
MASKRPRRKRPTFGGAFQHRPHVHRDGPTRFDQFFPKSGQNNPPIWSKQIIMAFYNMIANDVDM